MLEENNLLKKYKDRLAGTRYSRAFIEYNGVFYEVKTLAYGLSGSLRGTAFIESPNKFNVIGWIINAHDLYIVEPDEIDDFFESGICLGDDLCGYFDN